MLAAVLFAVMFIGQALTYFAVPNRYDASAELSGSEITYTISTNSAVTYTVLVYDNAKETERLFIYYDESYAVQGVTHAWQDRFIRQTISELSARGFTGEIDIVNADELSVALAGSAGEGDAVLMTSGVLPATVYSDTENKMFDWVDAGGSLYWMGYAIGAMYAVGNELRDALPTYRTDIFGADDCILLDQMRSAERSADPQNSALSSGLMLNNNNLQFGLNADEINSAGVHAARSLGFEHEGYNSVVLVERGDGMICVLGGSLGSAERVSVSQLISSGITASSLLIDSAGGSIVRNTVTGTVDVTGGSDIGIHIRMGSPNIVYARTFFF
jgi:hypothetical protein